MSSSSRKRKERGESQYTRAHNNLPVDPRSDQGLFIQAYEADIVRGPRARVAAVSLEVSEPDGVFPADPSRGIGGGLIRWNGIHPGALHALPAFPSDADQPEEEVISETNDDDDTLWVDRYDARLLLDHPLGTPSVENPRNVPDSPGGWSDLPSDTEDTFFFSPEEAEDYHRDKKRRYLEQAREERLQARQAEDGETIMEAWGGSDEEPDETQKDMMRRTALHILSSPNPAQLELRILANHGGNKQFAFLKGRWSRAWHHFKGKVNIERDQEKKEKNVGLGALADYPDSDENDPDEEGNGDKGTSSRVVPTPELQAVQGHDAEESAKQARRARAKEWAKGRRALKDGSK